MDNIWRRRFAPGYQRLKRPVMAYQSDYTHGNREIWHSHEQGQLVHAMRGVVRVLTPHGAWTVAPTDALWIAPGVDHELHMVGRVALRALRIEPDTAPWLWTECRHIAVSPLLRELILAMLEGPQEYAPDSNAAMCVPLLLRQLQRGSRRIAAPARAWAVRIRRPRSSRSSPRRKMCGWRRRRMPHRR